MAGTRLHASSPSGIDLLIIDDTAIVGLDLQDLLQRAGYRVLDPVFTHGEALAVLARVRPDAVLLSSSLGDGRAAAVAEQLQAAGIPFAVMTAQAAAEPLEPCFATAPCIDRPFADDQVIETVQLLLAGCSSAIDAGGTAPHALAPPPAPPQRDRRHDPDRRRRLQQSYGWSIMSEATARAPRARPGAVKNTHEAAWRTGRVPRDRDPVHVARALEKRQPGPLRRSKT